MDKVSIIIPTYNTNDSLERAIESVLRQTYENIEIIVVDDNNENSPGNIFAKNIMKKYKKNNKVKYIEHKINKNGSAARNTGVKNSTGKYVGFLDDDDVFYEDKIEKQMACLKNTKCDLCSCNYKKNGKKIFINPKKNILKNIFMLKNTPQTSSFLMNVDFYNKINGFDESYTRHQDYEFLVRAFQNGDIKIMDEILYERLDNGVNNIPNAEKMEKIKDKFLSEFNCVIEKYKLNKYFIYAKNYAYVSFLYLKQKKYKKFFIVIKDKGNIFSIYFLVNRIVSGIINKIF